MRLGLLADIHEHVEQLEWAIATLRAQDVDRFVMLGDVYEMGGRIEETVALLSKLDTLGVWGNHDFGLCRDVCESVRARYSSEVLAYFASLAPYVEYEDCRFQHIEHHLDPTILEDLWSFEEHLGVDAALGFAAHPHHRLFIGHFHRWEVHEPEGKVSWDGRSPISLRPDRRALVAVRAVCDGSCALYETESAVLVPYAMT